MEEYLKQFAIEGDKKLDRKALLKSYLIQLKKILTIFIRFNSNIEFLSLDYAVNTINNIMNNNTPESFLDEGKREIFDKILAYLSNLEANSLIQIIP